MAIRSTPIPVPAMVIPLVAGLLCLGVSRPGNAQSRPSQAEALFQSGLEKMRNREYSSACPDLAASYELEPMPGVLFTLAECEVSWGRVATALKQYQQFVSTLSSLAPARRQKFEERRHLALEQVSTLAPTVPLISISVTAGAPAELVVKRDGVMVTESSYGVQTPVDPGDMVITAEIEGQRPWQRHVHVSAHERANVVVPWPLAPAASAPTPVGAAVSDGRAPDKPREPQERKHDEAVPAANTGSSLDTWRYVAAGVGAVGFTVSLVAGGVALAKKGSVDEQCSDYRCSQAGLSRADSAKQAARISTIGFVVGLVGAAGFTGLSIVGKPKQAQAARLRMTLGGARNAGEIGLEGAF
jgi:hypothetical protein